MRRYSYKKQRAILIPIGFFIKNVPRIIVRGDPRVSIIRLRIDLIPAYVTPLGRIIIFTYEGKEKIEEIFKDEIPYTADVELHENGTGHLGPGPIRLSESSLPPCELLGHELLYITLPNTSVELLGNRPLFTSPTEIRIVYGNNELQKIVPTVIFFKPERYRGKKSVKLFNTSLSLNAYEGSMYIYDKFSKRVHMISYKNVYSRIELERDNATRVITLICEHETYKGSRRQSVLILKKALSNIPLTSIFMAGELKNVECKIKFSGLKYILKFHIIRANFKQRTSFLKSLLRVRDPRFTYALEEGLELMQYISTASFLGRLTRKMLEYDVILSPPATLGFLRLAYLKNGDYDFAEYVLMNALDNRFISLSDISVVLKLERAFRRSELKVWDNLWTKMYSEIISKRFIVL